ncbi:unnamed protein product [Angiostrongylus costaricensis]|uniref:Aamy domain-containing protein n=1 Tax=Angiostrongylus costaricensis TaxID=334426 RepID=A0A0R3PHI7_ANGCS|nr:unnamed protein product [Angiostrongylus costaricensis]
MKKFLLLGIDGFHIDHVSQLVVDELGKSDHDGAILVLKELTSSIKDFINSHRDLRGKEIVLFSSLRDIEQLHVKAREIGDLHYVIDNTFASLSTAGCTEGLAACVHSTLTAAYSRHESDSFTPYWQFSSPDSSRLASRFDTETANLLTFMQLTLPGALSLYYGQELGLTDVGDPPTPRGIMQWSPSGNDHHGFLSSGNSNIGKLFFAESEDTGESDNFETQYAEENSPLKVYQRLAKMRQRDQALMIGSTMRDTVDGDVIIYSRFVKGVNGTAVGTAFIVALNFGLDAASVDFAHLSRNALVPVNKDLTKAEVNVLPLFSFRFQFKSSNLQVAAVTPGEFKYRARQKVDLTGSPVILTAKQAIMMKF